MDDFKSCPLQASLERRRCVMCSVDFDGALWAMSLLCHYGQRHPGELPDGLVRAVVVDHEASKNRVAATLDSK